MQARIAQKDEALTRYQQLLEQARAEMTEMQCRHSDEMQTLQQQLHQKNEAAFKKYRLAIKESLNKPDNPVVTNEQVILYDVSSTVLYHSVCCCSFSIRCCFDSVVSATYLSA